MFNPTCRNYHKGWAYKNGCKSYQCHTSTNKPMKNTL